jgi:hypothetical protein
MVWSSIGAMIGGTGVTTVKTQSSRSEEPGPFFARIFTLWVVSAGPGSGQETTPVAESIVMPVGPT